MNMHLENLIAFLRSGCDDGDLIQIKKKRDENTIVLKNIKSNWSFTLRMASMEAGNKC